MTSIKTQTAKISVIVPCYNVEPYIKRCLNSLLNQTLSNIEIICIDDKSTDNTLEILKDFAGKNAHIHLIEQAQNCGAAAARNAGIDAAVGEYIGFVDADDFVDDDFFEKLYHKATQTKADIVKANAKITDHDFTKRYDDLQINRIRLYGKWYFMYQWWTGLYRGELIKKNNIKFPEKIISGQDIVFLSLCVAAANKVELCPDTFYHYLRRSDSLDEPILSPQKIESKINAVKFISEIYNKSDMPDDAYSYCYHQRWVLLKSFIERNPSINCKRKVAEAFIEMYQNCKDKNKLIEAHLKYNAANKNYIHFITSGNSEAFLNYIIAHPDSSAQNTVDGYSYTLYLFGFLPLIKISKNTKKFTIKFLGLNLLKIRQTKNGYRINLLYIPILRIKRK